MLNIKDYQEEITKLYQEGRTAKEISSILGFKYHQPVYNFFKKMESHRQNLLVYSKKKNKSSI